MKGYWSTGVERYAGIQIILDPYVMAGPRGVAVWIGRFELNITLDVSPKE